MKSEMVEKLKQILANSTQEEFDKDWAAIEELGLEGPSIEEFISSFSMANVVIKPTEVLEPEYPQSSGFISIGDDDNFVLAALVKFNKSNLDLSISL